MSKLPIPPQIKMYPINKLRCDVLRLGPKIFVKAHCLHTLDAFVNLSKGIHFLQVWPQVANSDHSKAEHENLNGGS